MTELLQKLLDAVKGLTFANVAVMAALCIVTIPTYFAYQVMNDPNLSAAVFNTYSELDNPTDCSLVYQQPTGGTGSYVIRAVLAERNAEVWYVSSKVRFKPDDAALAQYCAALTSVIDYARDPNNQPLPVFPGSERRIVPPAAPRQNKR